MARSAFVRAGSAGTAAADRTTSTRLSLGACAREPCSAPPRSTAARATTASRASATKWPPLILTCPRTAWPWWTTPPAWTCLRSGHADAQVPLRVRHPACATFWPPSRPRGAEGFAAAPPVTVDTDGLDRYQTYDQGIQGPRRGPAGCLRGHPAAFCRTPPTGTTPPARWNKSACTTSRTPLWARWYPKSLLSAMRDPVVDSRGARSRKFDETGPSKSSSGTPREPRRAEKRAG